MLEYIFVIQVHFDTVYVEDRFLTYLHESKCLSAIERVRLSYERDPFIVIWVSRMEKCEWYRVITAAELCINTRNEISCQKNKEATYNCLLSLFAETLWLLIIPRFSCLFSKQNCLQNKKS